MTWAFRSALGPLFPAVRLIDTDKNEVLSLYKENVGTWIIKKKRC